MPRLPIGGHAQPVAPRLRPYLPELRDASALFLPRMEGVTTPWFSATDPGRAVHAAVFERPSRLALPASSEPLQAVRPTGSADSLVLALVDAVFGSTPSERVLGATRLIEPLLGTSVGPQPIRFASAGSSLNIDHTSDTAPAHRDPWGMLMGGAALFAFSVHRRISSAT
ncbi:MAG: hypothetical protein HY778_07795 [Betaproteobacteria bacterium]|nr:hypothetical protein [Betaproteobacteria bacterium]